MEKLQQLAAHTAWLLDHLFPALQSEEGKEWIIRRRDCTAIANALAIILATPNGTINPETLDTFQAVVEEAREALLDWLNKLLAPTIVIELNEDDIPY